jgi:magnesium chelatase accessory protein
MIAAQPARAGVRRLLRNNRRMDERLDWDVAGLDWPHRAASRFVEVPGMRWHVQVLGDGPVLWLLHGTGASGHSWRGLMPLLAPSFTLVVPDLPGHGFSAALPASQQSLAGMSASLSALARTLDLPPRVVFGHSAGAALALRAAVDGGIEPWALVGVNAALLPFGGLAGLVFPTFARLMARHAALPRLFARRSRDAGSVRRLVASTGSRLDDEGLALYGRLIGSPAHVAGALAMMANWDLAGLWPDLRRLAVPLTLLVGSRDGTVPPDQAQRVAAWLPGTTVVKLPGLGHLAHEESPETVARALQGALGPLVHAKT